MCTPAVVPPAACPARSLGLILVSLPPSLCGAWLFEKSCDAAKAECGKPRHSARPQVPPAWAAPQGWKLGNGAAPRAGGGEGVAAWAEGTMPPQFTQADSAWRRKGAHYLTKARNTRYRTRDPGARLPRTSRRVPGPRSHITAPWPAWPSRARLHVPDSGPRQALALKPSLLPRAPDALPILIQLRTCECTRRPGGCRE
eukprot:scaffold3876_cov344-Prasinococcus_capsulatus_cf.AAC.5